MATPLSTPTLMAFYSKKRIASLRHFNIKAEQESTLVDGIRICTYVRKFDILNHNGCLISGRSGSAKSERTEALKFAQCFKT